MPLKRLLFVIVMLFLADPPRPATAGLVKYLGGQLGNGAIEKIEPALIRTVSDAGTVAGGLIDKTSTDLGIRLDQVDGILEQRLLQVTLSANSVIDNGLDRINADARQRIAQVGGEVDKAIDTINDKLADRLQQVNDILTDQVDHVGGVVTASINQADQALGARIEQIDEIAGRRLGNVDVIATKQRLGLEKTIVRSAWLIGLVVFVIVILKALWNEYDTNSADIKATAAGTPRTRKYISVLAPPLLKHAAVGAAVAVLLATVPQRLPMAATKDQAALVGYHTRELERSVAALDWTETRFHASQLEFLDAPNTPHYKVLEAKADLLRDLLGRPTCLATEAGRGQILTRIEAVERLGSGRLDPDGATARAMVLWRQGDQRSQEHQAAALAARALWSSPQGFTLAPMARILVEAYVHAPDPDEASPASADLESSRGLEALLTMPAPPLTGSPFEGAVALFHLMEKVDAESSAAYIQMIEAQAKVALKRDFQANIATRNAAANRVVQAWETFDAALGTTPALTGNPLVLQVFRLNDVYLSHALWFQLQPTTTDWPRMLDDLKGKDIQRLKVAIAPARITWARRYTSLMQGPARTLLEAQESGRYLALEDATLKFEGSYCVSQGAPAPPAPKVKSRRIVVARSPDAATNALEAADAAATLGLYRASAPGASAQRSPLALELSRNFAGSVDGLRKKLETGTDQLRKDADTKAGAGKKAVDQLKVDLINRLLGRLSTRGTRLI